jgi:acetolactate synthase-1/2/3 large subunit
LSGSRGGSLSAELWALGVRCVFGLPGTQNVALIEDLRKGPLRLVLATSELAASFMAVGHARASGLPGVLVTIPGPGFTYALPGLAEARLDSVPLLHLVVHQPLPPGKRFRHQEIEHLEIVRPLVKGVVEVEKAWDVPRGLDRAWRLAQEGEPGPVVLWISAEALGTQDEEGKLPGPPAPSSELAEGSIGQKQVPGPEAPNILSQADDSPAARLLSAQRPILFLGLGSVDCAEWILELIERVNVPFFTTVSARGVIPEDHPLCLAFDFDGGGLSVLNEMLATSDLVMALGCKLGHNGTGGFRLRLPEGALLHVNSDPESLGANYPASLLVRSRVEDLEVGLQEALQCEKPLSAWNLEEIALWRSRIADAEPAGPPEPIAPGVSSKSVREVIEILREELPRDAIVVTDSGLHQMMIRRHFRVLASRGLIMPTDFQSMGFGLPAAIGAKLAAPEREVVAVIGDGGLAMSGMELLTLVRERVPITVFVFNDGYLNLIRLQQERDFGHGHAVRLMNPEMETLAEACGAAFVRLDGGVREGIRTAIGNGVPTLVDVPLGDSREMSAIRFSRRTKALTRQVFGEGLVGGVKRLLRWGGP